MYDKPLISIGKFEVYPYGLLIAIGILCCFFVLYYYGKIRGVKSSMLDFTFYNGIASIGIGFLAAALWQATYNFIDNPKGGFHFGGGITFIGGLIGGIVCFLCIYFISRKKLKGRIVDILSLAPCCITIAHGFGRIGCLMAGCCHGNYLGQNYVFGGIKMAGTIEGQTVIGYYVPTQLYEALFLFALFVLFSNLYLKYKFEHNLSLYLVLYGIFRFFIEFARADYRGKFIGVISPSQFWSILMVVGGVALYFLIKPAFAKRKMELEQEKLALKAEQDAEILETETCEQSPTEINNINEDTPTNEDN